MDSFNKLKEWLKIKDNIKLFERPERGIYSTKNIKKNQPIITIKAKYLLEYNYIYSLYPIDDIEECNSLVAFYLLKQYVEQNRDKIGKNDSFWSPYIASFPNDISEHLYYWSENKLKQLNNTSLMTHGFYNYHKHMETLQYDWNIIYEYIIHNDLFNNIDYDYDHDKLYDIYIKLRILVGSRIFGYTKFGIEESGMVPYVDMINHSFESNTTWYFDDNIDSFILQSVVDIPKGVEIVDDYGNKSNIDLLLFYGFTLKNNPYPLIRINLENQIYELTLDTDLDKINTANTVTELILFLNKMKNKINNLYDHHNNMISKIKDDNIKNIYMDEMIIFRIFNDKLKKNFHTIK